MVLWRRWLYRHPAPQRLLRPYGRAGPRLQVQPNPAQSFPRLETRTRPPPPHQLRTRCFGIDGKVYPTIKGSISFLRSHEACSARNMPHVYYLLTHYTWSQTLLLSHAANPIPPCSITKSFCFKYLPLLLKIPLKTIKRENAGMVCTPAKCDGRAIVSCCI